MIDPKCQSNLSLNPKKKKNVPNGKPAACQKCMSCAAAKSVPNAA